MAKSYVRPRGGVILIDPETGAPVGAFDEMYETDHPMVKAYRWAFASDEELAGEKEAHQPVESVKVERATKRPGEKRAAKRS